MIAIELVMVLGVIALLVFVVVTLPLSAAMVRYAIRFVRFQAKESGLLDEEEGKGGRH